MPTELKRLTSFLVALGIERIPHTGKNYLAHLVSVYKLMESYALEECLCQAGLFHSIYGTQLFQGFKLPLTSRAQLQALIGERAEGLAFWNCMMHRPTFDSLLAQAQGPYPVPNRETGEEMLLTKPQFDDLCRVHLFDWLEQVPRSTYGWGYRREAYRQMAERLDDTARRAYDSTFAHEATAVLGQGENT